MRVLIIEDDRTLTAILERLLREDGFAVDTAGTTADGQLQAVVNDYDAIVLDLNLPDGSGLSLIQELRSRGKDSRILVLTGTRDSGTTVQALDAGADDYVVKPVAFAEFRARLRALVRRGGAQRAEQLSAGNLVLNRLRREAFVSGRELVLTQRELTMLEEFLLRSGEVVSRSVLAEKVWDAASEPGANVIEVGVARLRRKLKDCGASVTIGTRRGAGYVLETMEEGPSPTAAG
jgi:DNA-binding response OmpR family regulator